MKAAWSGFFLSLSLCLDLGIVNLAVLRTALSQGGSAGFLVGIGSSIGDLIYFALAVLGATALLGWAPVRWPLWLFGTCVLLFFAWRMAREVIHPRDVNLSETRATAEQGPFKLLASGLGLALASPGSILWFAAVGGSIIASFGNGRHSLWTFAAGFFLAAILWSALFAYGAAALRRILGGYLVRVLSFLSALLFLYLAAFVFIHGLRQMF